jgi:hypothetical protein
LVPRSSLGDILRENGLASRYALVVDIEGAEFDLFENDRAALSRCTFAIVEIHPVSFTERGRRTAEFHRLVDEAGFEIVDRIGNVLALKSRSATGER